MIAQMPVQSGFSPMVGIVNVFTGCISATAFSNQMLAAKSVMDASTEEDIRAVLPIANGFISEHSLDVPMFDTTPGRTIDVGYFNNKFQPHLANGLRGIFDQRLSSRSFSVSSQIELRKFASVLPDIATAGFLTFDVVDEYFGEQIRLLNEQILEVKRLPKASEGIPPESSNKSIYGLISIVGVSLCLAATLKDQPALAVLAGAGSALMMYLASKYSSAQNPLSNLSVVQKMGLTETQIAVRAARGKLRKNGKDIRVWQEKPLPLIS